MVDSINAASDKGFKKTLIIELIKGSLIFLAAVIGSYFTLQSKEENADIQRYKMLADDNRSCYSDLRSARTKFTECSFATLDLRSRISREEDPLKVLERFIDSFPYPVWLKRFDPELGEFIPILINKAYEIRYEITKDRYQNTSERHLWPADIFAEFQANDHKVYARRGYIFTKESIPTKADIYAVDQERVVGFKSAFRYLGDEYLVFGMLTE